MRQSSVLVTLAISILVVATACSAEQSAAADGRDAGSVVVTSTEPLQADLLDPEGDFVLNVSNQSQELDLVDITVEVDGQVVCQDDFANGNLHEYQRFVLAVGPGKHWLTATSAEGSAVLIESFQVTGKKWAVVSYHDASGTVEPADRGEFAFLVSDSPIAIK